MDLVIIGVFGLSLMWLMPTTKQMLAVGFVLCVVLALVEQNHTLKLKIETLIIINNGGK